MPKGFYKRTFKAAPLPSDGVFRFPVRVRREGSKDKNGLQVTLSRKALRGLVEHGWDKTWLDVSFAGSPFQLLHVRFDSNGNGTVAVPLRDRVVELGDEVEAAIRDPGGQRIVAEVVQRGIDLAEFVPEEYFVRDAEDGFMDICSRYEEPFRVKRFVSDPEVFWLLGFYQAEGSKSETAVDWSLANKSDLCLERCVNVLGLMGVETNRIYVELLYGEGQDAEFVKQKFGSLNVEVTSIRKRPGRGREAAVLHVRNSKPFMQTMCVVLKYLVKDLGIKIQTKLCAQKYALGAFDGDGTVTIKNTSATLKLAGYPEERNAARIALHMGFSWNDISTEVASRDMFDTCRSLPYSHILDLLEAGAFVGLTSRARMVLFLSERVEYLTADEWLRYANFEEEETELRKFFPEGVIGTGVKGLMFPPLR